jgi:hypothetical protein
MKLRALFSLLFLVGCQDYASNSQDRLRFGPLVLTGSDEFKAAYPILRNQCANCHYHSAWSGYTDEQTWIQRGLIRKGDVDASPAITKIFNYGSPSSNMPLGGGPLRNDEYQILVDWVNAP